MNPVLIDIDRMSQADLAEVWDIEQTITGPWTYGQLKDELALPHGWHLVARIATASDGTNTCQPSIDNHLPNNCLNEPAPTLQPILGYIFGTTIIGEAEIRKIAVASRSRRQGVGSALLAAVDQLLVALSVTECFLELRATNSEALALYQKNGFQKIGQRKNYYTQPADDAILLKKYVNTQVS